MKVLVKWLKSRKGDKLCSVQIFPLVAVTLVLLCLEGVAGQKGGAKGAMRGRGKGGKSRGGSSRSRGGSEDMGGYGDNFGGGYGGKGRPCVGLCYLRSEIES